MCQVYKITNLINNKCYIGITKYIFHVRYNYRNDWWNAPSVNKLLKQSVNKYGYQNFKVTILEDDIDINKLEDLEKYYINFYNSVAPYGYNLTHGGNYSKKLSEETKLKISLTKKEYFKDNIVWNKNKKLSKEHIENSIKTKKERFASGKTITWNKGLKTGRPSETAIKNSAIAHYKPIALLDSNENIEKVYRAVKDVRFDGFNPSSACRVAKQKLKTHQNRKFKHISEEEYITHISKQ